MATARSAEAAVQADVARAAAQRAELACARAMFVRPEAQSRRSQTVTAPASGSVTGFLQESARTVGAGAPLVEIGDQDGLEAAIEFMSQDRPLNFAA